MKLTIRLYLLLISIISLSFINTSCELFYGGFSNNSNKGLLDPNDTTLYQENMEFDTGDADAQASRSGAIPSNTNSAGVTIRFSDLKSGSTLASVQNLNSNLTGISTATYGDATQTFNVYRGDYVSIFTEIEPSSQGASKVFFQLFGADQYVEFIYSPALAPGTIIKTTFKIPSNTNSGQILAQLSIEGTVAGDYSNTVSVKMNVVNPVITPTPPTSVTFTTVKSTTTTLPNITYTTGTTNSTLTTTQTTQTVTTVTITTSTSSTSTVTTQTTQTITTTTLTTVTTLTTSTTSITTVTTQTTQTITTTTVTTLTTTLTTTTITTTTMTTTRTTSTLTTTSITTTTMTTTLSTTTMTPTTTMWPLCEPFVAYTDSGNNKNNIIFFNGSNWQTLVSNLSIGNGFNTRLKFKPLSDELYVAYNNGSNSTVMRHLSDSSFAYIGPPTFGPPSFGMSFEFDPNNGQPTIAVSESGGSLRASVFQFNGTTTWNLVGGVPVSQGQSSGVDIAFSPTTGELHAAFGDYAYSGNKFVKNFNGSWSNVAHGGSGIANTQNGSRTNIAFKPSGDVVIAFQDGAYSSATSLMITNGAAWNDYIASRPHSASPSGDQSMAIRQSDGVVFTAFNNSTSYLTVLQDISILGPTNASATTVDLVSLAIHPLTGQPYVAYRNSSSTLSVIKWNGSSWVTVGSPGTPSIADTHLAFPECM